jgi:hypothetical protein
MQALFEYFKLWDLVQELHLSEVEDSHLWRFSTTASFTTKSAYEAFFAGSITFEPWRRLWKSWAPAKCKTFLWLAIRNRCWTADRLRKRGLQHPVRCVLCDQEEEDVQHILTTCVFTRVLVHNSECHWSGCSYSGSVGELLCRLVEKSMQEASQNYEKGSKLPHHPRVLVVVEA